MKKFKAGNIISHIHLIILVFTSISPLVWIIISSLKEKGELTGNLMTSWPKTWIFDYYAHIINDLKFFANIKNSIIISLVTTLVATMATALVTCGIVRSFTQLGSAMSRVLATTYTLPPILLATPYSVIMGKLGLINTRIGLVIMYLPFSVPYAMQLLTGPFRTVPLEIEEAIRTDGANKVQTFVRVVLPLVAPGMVAMAIYAFINTWNEFLYVLILMNNTSKMIVAVAPHFLDGAEILDQDDMMAASVLMVLPSVIFSYLIQNKITGGVSNGVMKS